MRRTTYILHGIISIVSSILLFACSHNKLNTMTLNLPLKPYLQIDNTASEIIFEQWNVESKTQPQVYKWELSQKIENLLNRERMTSDAVIPVRYKINVSYYQTNYIFTLFPCLVVYTLLGCPKNSTEIQVHVYFEIAKNIYKASVHDTYYSGLAYDHDGIYSLENTIFKAFKQIARRIRKDI